MAIPLLQPTSLAILSINCNRGSATCTRYNLDQNRSCTNGWVLASIPHADSICRNPPAARRPEITIPIAYVHLCTGITSDIPVHLIIQLVVHIIIADWEALHGGCSLSRESTPIDRAHGQIDHPRVPPHLHDPTESLRAEATIGRSET